MGRPRREQVPGGFYHVTMRGNRRAAVFHDDRDRHRFLAFVTEVVSKHQWRCHAYCLMTNHVHLLVETPEANISSGMCVLNGRYARWFNGRHGFAGHVFERRFRSALVLGERHFVGGVRYIVLNPVRAGLCETADRWRWSSYRATAYADARVPRFLTVDFVLAHFADDRERARQLFADFVAIETAAIRATRLAAMSDVGFDTPLVHAA